MDTIATYTNGNTKVSILEDGSKTREYEGTPVVLHPESIDVKITNYCDLACFYCHESSTTAGRHADLDVLESVLSELPAGVELAIGGGNPLSHPDLVSFLWRMKEKGIICNITVNQGHLYTYRELLTSLIRDKLVKGIGISITSNNFKIVSHFLALSKHIVYHVIAGVNKLEIIDRLIELGPAKILVLGYKKFGFGARYHNEEIDEEIYRWKRHLPDYLGKCVLSFDNLAIEQLNIRRLFTKEGWEQFYMGDDFCFTMYIDAVKQQYAPTSRSTDRHSFADYSLCQYFNKYKDTDESI